MLFVRLLWSDRLSAMICFLKTQTLTNFNNTSRINVVCTKISSLKWRTVSYTTWVVLWAPKIELLEHTVKLSIVNYGKRESKERNMLSYCSLVRCLFRIKFYCTRVILALSLCSHVLFVRDVVLVLPSRFIHQTVFVPPSQMSYT